MESILVAFAILLVLLIMINVLGGSAIYTKTPLVASTPIEKFASDAQQFRDQLTMNRSINTDFRSSIIDMDPSFDTPRYLKPMDRQIQESSESEGSESLDEPTSNPAPYNSTEPFVRVDRMSQSRPDYMDNDDVDEKDDWNASFEPERQLITHDL